MDRGAAKARHSLSLSPGGFLFFPGPTLGLSPVLPSYLHPSPDGTVHFFILEAVSDLLFLSLQGPNRDLGCRSGPMVVCSFFDTVVPPSLA